GSLELQVEVEVVQGQFNDAVVRCTISDSADAGRGRPVWALLGNPKSAGFAQWKKDVLEFAANLPHTSQGEASPADRDPIPPPWNNTYNQPERDAFHTRVKYFRD